MQTFNMLILLFILLCSSSVVYSNEIETLVNSILSEIQNLKTRQAVCDSKVSKLEAEVTQLKKCNDMFEQDVAIQKNNNEAKQFFNESSLLKRGLVSSGQVAFTVGVSAGDLTHLGDHHTVVFDKAITNIGDTYNTNTGIFQAPLKGAYVFTLTMMVLPRHSEYLEIVVDGIAMNDILADASSVDDYMSTTKQWILQLNSGSNVWIRTSSFENRGEIHGALHTLFNGFLLFEME